MVVICKGDGNAEADMTMAAISALFVEKQIKPLPIIDVEGRPVGIVTRTDLVQSYCLPEGGHS